MENVHFFVVIRKKCLYKKLISDMEDMISRTHDLDTKEKLAAALQIVTADARYVMETLSRFQVENGPSESKPQ